MKKFPADGARGRGHVGKATGVGIDPETSEGKETALTLNYRFAENLECYPAYRLKTTCTTLRLIKYHLKIDSEQPLSTVTHGKVIFFTYNK
jgi:hypothetical protein